MRRRALKLALLGVLAAGLWFGQMELTVSGEFQVLPVHNADIRAQVEAIVAEVLVADDWKIARGLAEMARFAAALKVDPRTLMGLSGLGDLTLTCTSETSRNYTVGKALGEGATPDDVKIGRRSVAEGVFTAPAVLTRAKALGVELPICAAIDTILHDNADIDATIADVLARPFRPEF